MVEALEAITAPQKYKKVLKAYAPFKRLIYQGKGREARALFDQKNLPRKEQVIRNRLRNEGYWMRRTLTCRGGGLILFALCIDHQGLKV